MPAPIRVTLNDEEDRTLLELSYTNGVPQRTKQRAMTIRLNTYDWNMPQIAQYHDWHEHTVHSTLERWQGQGLGGLWEATGRGRPRRWSEEDGKAIEQWATEPRRYSARQLSEKLAQQRQVHLGAEQVRRMLKKRGTFGNV